MKFNFGKKQAVTIVAAVMLFVLYSLIFSFSDQDAERSGSLSYMISEKCVEIFNALSGKQWTAVFRQELAAYFENPIRKFAHLTEYAVMGVLFYTMWRPWKSRDKKLYTLVIFWVFFSAAGDEIHQLFVPGRYGGFADVILDTCGGSFGVFLCVCAEKLYNRYQKARVEKRLHNKKNPT